MRRALLLLIVAGAGACAERTVARAASPEADAASAEGSPRVVQNLDDRIREMWRDAGVVPSPPVDDAGFLRRVSIDLTGQIPGPEDVRAFLADEDPRKRAALVERLLSSDEATEHLGEVLVDMFVPWEYQRLPVYGGAPREWFTEALASGRTWRDMATELITASGRVHDRGAAGYVASNLQGATTEMLAAAVLEDMLGLGAYRCAQCHDHPEREDIRQADFMGVVAFLSRTRIRNDRSKDGRTLRVEDRPVPRAPAHPAVAPSFFGRAPAEDAPSLRAALASHVTADPRLADAFVDRAWTHFFGRPLGDPGARVREELAAGLRASGYEIRPLLRRIALSTAYERDSRAAPAGEGDPVTVFARAPIRPLTAMNLYRAIGYATSIDPDLPTFLPLRNVERSTARHQRSFHEVFPTDAGGADATGTLAQALKLLNGPLIYMAAKARPGSRLQYLFDRYPDDRARMEELYLTVLGRFPRPDELEADLSRIAAAPRVRWAWEDVLFGMLISTEFLTNH